MKIIGKLFTVFSICLSIGVFYGCSKDSSSSTSSSYTPTCTGTKSYSTDVAPLIASKCRGCHNNYSTYAQLSSSKSSVRNAVASGSMPQGSSLTSAQKDIIVCWLDNGALNN